MGVLVGTKIQNRVLPTTNCFKLKFKRARFGVAHHYLELEYGPHGVYILVPIPAEQ